MLNRKKPLTPFSFLVSLATMISYAYGYTREFGATIYVDTSALANTTLSGKNYNDTDHYCLSMDGGSHRLMDHSTTYPPGSTLQPRICSVMYDCEDEYYYKAAIDIIGKDINGKETVLDSRLFCLNQAVQTKGSFAKHSLFATDTGRAFDTYAIYDGFYGLGSIVGVDASP